METLTVKACRETRLCVYWFVGEKSRQETKTDGYCARPMGETLTFGSAGCTHSLYYNSAYGTALIFNSSIEKLLASRDSSPDVEKQRLLLRREEKSLFISRTWLAGFVSVISMFFGFFLQHQSVYKVSFSFSTDYQTTFGNVPMGMHLMLILLSCKCLQYSHSFFSDLQTLQLTNKKQFFNHIREHHICFFFILFL